MWARHRRRASDGTWDNVLAVLLTRSDAVGQIDWAVSVDSTINRAHQYATNIRRPEVCGATAHTRVPQAHYEPPGHAIGRSRGGLTTKVHHAVDGRGRPLAVVVTPGQAHDGLTLQVVLNDLHVPRAGPGRPRTRRELFLVDKDYSCRAIRHALRLRGVRAVIPERRDQQKHRRGRGQEGGRAPSFDPEVYKGRNVVERLFALLKQWRGLATRFD